MKRLALLLATLCLLMPGNAFAEQPAALTAAEQMQLELSQTDVPPANPEAIARHFNLLQGELPPIALPPQWALGMRALFAVILDSARETTTIQAEIIYVGEHTVFWLDVDSPPPLSDAILEQFAHFDQVVYPLEHQIFGDEPSPGIDHDPRIHILFSNIGGLLGYYSSRDAEPPAISPNSNAKEMVLLNSSMLRGNPLQITNTLSHEFQHMIHSAADPNENSIIDEGLSGLAELLTGNRLSDSYERSFLLNPDISLSYWPIYDSAIPSYGASFLFMKFILDQFDVAFIRQLVREPANGLDGIDKVLEQRGLAAPEWSADQLYTRWMLTNLLAGLGLSSAEYRYKDYTPPIDDPGKMIRTVACEENAFQSSAQQYGTDYYRVSCPEGRLRITLSAQPVSPILSFDPLGGDFAWWTNAVNQSDTTLRRAFDFSGISEAIWLEYDVQTDIEEAYDFLYLTISSDGGETWQTLKPSGGTDANPSGYNLGWGYTGRSGGWLHERVDLSEYQGQQVLLQFEMITDQAKTSEGALIDNIRIDAVDFLDDVETAAAGWQAAGFVRLRNSLPQRFALTAITGTLDAFEPQVFFKNPVEELTFECEFTKGLSSVCAFGISPLNRYSRQKVDYELKFTPVVGE